eukprot:gene7642-17204_t
MAVHRDPLLTPVAPVAMPQGPQGHTDHCPTVEAQVLLIGGARHPALPECLQAITCTPLSPTLFFSYLKTVSEIIPDLSDGQDLLSFNDKVVCDLAN